MFNREHEIKLLTKKDLQTELISVKKDIRIMKRVIILLLICVMYLIFFYKG